MLLFVCVLCVAGWLLFVGFVRCVLIHVCCLLFGVNCMLFVVCCLLLVVVCCLLRVVVCCLLFGVCYLLVCCLRFGGCCLLLFVVVLWRNSRFVGCCELFAISCVSSSLYFVVRNLFFVHYVALRCLLRVAFCLLVIVRCSVFRGS